MSYEFPDSVLLIFCKAPIPGQVKTRLQPALTAEQAVNAHIRLTRMTLDRATQLSLCPIVMYGAPDSQHAFLQACAKDYSLTLARQTGKDLGERMHNAFRDSFSHYRHTVLIGCDCPSLTVDDLREAFSALKHGSDVVIGPAEDGGYVLIGLSTPHSELLTDMNWGFNSVWGETRRRAALANLNVHELGMQWDVDTFEDWTRFLNTV